MSGNDNNNQNETVVKPEVQETKANDFESLPDWAKTEIKSLRTESAENRTTAKSNKEALEALQSKISRFLGTEEEPTVEALQEKLEASQRQSEERAREFEVYKAASRHGVDPEGLLDSVRFLKRLEAGEDIDTLVLEYKPKSEAKEDKKSTKSGPDFSGSTSKTHIFTPEEIKAMTPAEFAKHREAILKQQLGS